MKRKYLTALLCLLMANISLAQDTAQLTGFKQKLHTTFYREDYGKNVIRWDPTPAFIFEDTRNFTVGYERIRPNNQSWSINVGLLFIPMLLGDSLDKTSYSEQQSGFLVSTDYRFYLKKLNTRPAPCGVYIGPYFSVYSNKASTTFDYLDSSIVSSTAKFDREFLMVNAGFQMGYQYVFWKRLAVDVVFFGPSLTYYTLDMNLQSGLSDQEREDFYNSLPGNLTNRLPLVGSLIQNGKISKQGSLSSLTSGFRYCIQIGYVF